MSDFPGDERITERKEMKNCLANTARVAETSYFLPFQIEMKRSA